MVPSLSNGQKAALIVNEAQVGVLDPDHAMFPELAKNVVARGIVPKLAKLADAFRAAGHPVFHTPVVHRPDHLGLQPNTLINALSLKRSQMIKGAKEADFVDELRPKEGDFVIERTSGIFTFVGTELDTLLRRQKIETVVMSGVSSNLAIPGNVMVASDLGYNVVVPEDCIAGAETETHDIVVKNQLSLLARVVSLDDIIASIS